MSYRTLVGELRVRGLNDLARRAETLTAERDAALQQAWTDHCTNEQLRARLHAVIGQLNELRRDR